MKLMGYLTLFFNEIIRSFYCFTLNWLPYFRKVNDVLIISIHTLKELLELATIQSIGHYETQL